MFIGNIPSELILFFILYGITGVMPLIAALYLLFRRGNAIAAGVTPPVRLYQQTEEDAFVSTIINGNALTKI